MSDLMPHFEFYSLENSLIIDYYYYLTTVCQVLLYYCTVRYCQVLLLSYDHLSGQRLPLRGSLQLHRLQEVDFLGVRHGHALPSCRRHHILQGASGSDREVFMTTNKPAGLRSVRRRPKKVCKDIKNSIKYLSNITPSKGTMLAMVLGFVPFIIMIADAAFPEIETVIITKGSVDNNYLV